MDPLTKRMARIRAMVRKSRMDGWGGMVPGAVITEYVALARIAEPLFVANGQ